jgi:hypothetical protein
MTTLTVHLTRGNDKGNLMANKPDSTELPADFSPSEFDVICGWARQNYHYGRFRELGFS